mmetsp:Transcript_14843/g.21238  ORF Transcript_14843/g.21238 Transcript_14843/m.21238 type:complete len:412 (+) Transcript_14843:616-1851(+)
MDVSLIQLNALVVTSQGISLPTAPQLHRGGWPQRPQVTQFRHSFTQVDDIPSTWILLDTCLGGNCANNGAILSNIRPCAPGEELLVYTNGGFQFFTQVRSFDMFGIDLHYNPASLANILSYEALADIDGIRIVSDSGKERAFKVFYNGFCYKFKPCSDRLYYYDLANPDSTPVKAPVQGAVESDSLAQGVAGLHAAVYSCVQTVAENKTYFTKNEIERAEEARRLQHVIGWSSDGAFKKIIAQNMLRNCHISVDGIVRAEAIFGKAKPLCKGKMTNIPSTTFKIQKIPLPPSIAKHQQRLSLHIDIFFVNKIPFFHTKSGKIYFITTQVLQSRSSLQIIKVIPMVKDIYENRGFNITDIFGDNEFNITKLKTILSPVNLHLCGRDEHVPIIERSIRTIKERSRLTTHALPF